MTPEYPWEQAFPGVPSWQIIPARSGHDPRFVLYDLDTEARTYELHDEKTGEKLEIGTSGGGLYAALDIAEMIVCDHIGATPHERNMLR